MGSSCTECWVLREGKQINNDDQLFFQRCAFVYSMIYSTSMNPQPAHTSQPGLCHLPEPWSQLK